MGTQLRRGLGGDDEMSLRGKRCRIPAGAGADIENARGRIGD